MANGMEYVIPFEKTTWASNKLVEKDLWYNLAPRYNLTNGFSKCDSLY